MAVIKVIGIVKWIISWSCIRPVVDLKISFDSVYNRRNFSHGKFCYTCLLPNNLKL